MLADLDLLLTKHGLRERPAAPKASLKTPEPKDRDDLTALPTLLLQTWSGAEAPILPAVSLETTDTGLRLWVHAPAVAERVAARLLNARRQQPLRQLLDRVRQ